MLRHIIFDQTQLARDFFSLLLSNQLDPPVLSSSQFAIVTDDRFCGPKARRF